ncbi:MAG: DUF4175 family protein [Planctomycetota bacterium]|nr:DUF4175 family protein [Planctomycetota bacterium]
MSGGNGPKGYGELARRVSEVERARRARIIAAGILIMAGVFIAGFLLYSAADIWMKLSPAWRAFSLAATLAAVSAAAFAAIFAPIRASGGPRRAARDVEAKFPDFENNLSTAVEYGSDPELAARTSSPALVEALVGQTLDRGAGLDLKKAVPWRRVARAALGASLPLAVLAVYCASSPRLAAATWKRFLRPGADIPPPTLTVIEKVEPGNAQVPMECSRKVVAELSGLVPSAARIRFRVGDGEWRTARMEPEGDGRFAFEFPRLMEDIAYQVCAGDAESDVFRLEVYLEPKLEELEITLEYPEYTGRGAEVLPPGQGDIRALVGTRATVRARVNLQPSSAAIRFASDAKGERTVAANVAARALTASFVVERDDFYSIGISDAKGRRNDPPPRFRIVALPDRPPSVRVRKPDPDVSAHRNQDVEIEVEASDDFGLREIGICHSLGLETARTVLKRFDKPPAKDYPRLKWNLAAQGFKGGEVVAYYAYALDNDARGGPKEARSGIQFLTLYDEDEYLRPKEPKERDREQAAPEAVRQLDRLIEAQKRLLRETFAEARGQTAVATAGTGGAISAPGAQTPGSQAPDAGGGRAAGAGGTAGKDTKTGSAAGPRETASGTGSAATDPRRKACARLADTQAGIREKVEAIVHEVREQLAAMPPEDGKPPAGGHHGEGGGDGGNRKDTGLGARELEHLERASERMKDAEKFLTAGSAGDAVPPETEALRRLSETRRLLLSDQDGDPRMRQAMNRQSKNRRRREQEAGEEEEQRKQIQEELAQLPPMLERQKEIERDLQELIRRRAQAHSGTPPPEEQREQRRLRRKAEENVRKQAEEAAERAERRDRMQRRDAGVPGEAARKAEESRAKFEEAARRLAEGDPEKAQDAANEAMRMRLESDRQLERSMDRRFERAMRDAIQDAARLADEQRELAARQAAPAGAQAASGSAAGKPQDAPEAEKARLEAARRQEEMAEDLASLRGRLERLASQALDRRSPAAPDLGAAAEMTAPEGEASRAMEKAAAALKSGKSTEAARSQRDAADGLAGIERRLGEALSRHEAADAAEVARLAEEASKLAERQAKAENELRSGPALSARQKQEKNAADASALASLARDSVPLRNAGRAGGVAERLEKAASLMLESNRESEAEGGGSRKAVEAAEKATRETRRAAAEIRDALDEMLARKAAEAAARARETRENGEKAAGALRAAGQDEAGPAAGIAAAKDAQEKAAAAARRLEGSARDMARVAEAAGDEHGKQAKDIVDRIVRDGLPEKAAELASRISAAAAGQRESGQKAADMAGKAGEIAAAAAAVEKEIRAFAAGLKGGETERLKALAEKAREAGEEARRLASEAAQHGKESAGAETSARGEETGRKEARPAETGRPEAGKPERGGEGKREGIREEAGEKGRKEIAGEKGGEQRGTEAREERRGEAARGVAGDASARAEMLARELESLLAGIERMLPGSEERKEAVAALEKARRASALLPRGPQAASGAFSEAARHIQIVGDGIIARLEREIKAREISEPPDENAPAQYRPLIERYYRALSEDKGR